MQTQAEKRLAPIESLPVDTHKQMIFNHLSNKELYRLSQTSREMLFYCQPHLQERPAQKLLSHVVKGEEAQALKMIDAKPTLLLHASNATDYSARPYNNRTPFQAALLCHDVTLWKKMEPYFDILRNGQEEKVRQFNALFPEGIPQQRPYDFNTLAQTISTSSEVDIHAALDKTQNNTAICNALNHFRSDFTALAMQEMFFNPSHLIKALNVYHEQFDNWSWAQRDLFWRQVIGYTERFLPACLAQALIEGLYDIVEEHQPLGRSLKFKYEAGSYFPLVDLSGLGFDFAVFAGAERGASVAAGAGGRAARWRVPELLNYVEQIRQNYFDLSIACCTGSPLQTITP